MWLLLHLETAETGKNKKYQAKIDEREREIGWKHEL